MATYMMEKNKLTGEYEEVFEKAELYAMLSGIEDSVQEDMLMNLVDLLYTAQTEEKPASKIIGKDIEQFCKEYFQEQRGIIGFLYGIPAWLYRLSIILLIFEIPEFFFLMEEPGFQVWTVSTDVSGFIVGILIGGISSCIVLLGLRPLFLRLKKVNTTVIMLLILIFDCTAVIVITLKFEIETVSVPIFPVILLSATFVIGYKCCQRFQRYQKTGSIKKPKKVGTFREVYREAQKKEMPKALRKRMEKMNKQLQRRGKPELTKQAFTEKMRRGYKVSMLIVTIFYIVLWAGMTILDAVQGQWWPDTIIFAAILAVVFAGCYKMSSSNYTNNLLKACEKKGTNIIDLAESMAEEREMV